MKKVITSIDQINGIGENIVKKLNNAGFFTLHQIANSNPRKLEELEGIGKETAIKLIIQAREALGVDDFLTGVQIEQDEAKIVRITTGSKELDELLLAPKLRGKVRGGFESMLITEGYGRYSSGKSQLGFQLAVNVQLPVEQGGLDGCAVFLDTESTWRSSRIREIAESRGMDAEKVLQNIFVARVMSTDHIQKLLIKADELIRTKNVKLIVIDSITAPFRHEYRGREELPARQGALSDVLSTLQNMANIYNIPVYVTNQVMDMPNALPYVDSTIPVGGNILAHATCRLYLRKSKDNRRVVRLVDSSALPLGEAMFQITEKGIEDVET